MSLVRVGVLRGGPSSEYESSLKTGQTVLSHLPSQKYQPLDILITKDGTWHLAGLPITPAEAAREVDVFFNALHGTYGEDGTIQRLLDQLLVPYTGSGAFSSKIGMEKHTAKEYLKREGVKIPLHVMAYFGDDVLAKTTEVFNRIGPPWIVKPADRGFSQGLAKVVLLHNLPKAIEQAFDYSPNIMIEEFIKGTEVTCNVVENFREQKYYSFEPHSASATSLTAEEIFKLKHLAVLAHKALDLRHYSQADFIVSPRGVYLLEVNTQPHLYETSSMFRVATADGLAYGDFLDHLLKLSLKSF